MSRTYATLDPNRIGTYLALDQGNLVVTTTADGTDSSGTLSMERAAFGTLAKAIGKHYFECYFYSESQGDLSLLLSVGICEPQTSVQQYVGRASTSYGFRAADGGIWNDNDEIAEGEIVGERRCIGVMIDLSAPTCTWYIEGSEYATIDLPADKLWVPAVSIGSDSAGDVSAFLNFGQRAFENQPSEPL